MNIMLSFQDFLVVEIKSPNCLTYTRRSHDRHGEVEKPCGGLAVKSKPVKLRQALGARGADQRFQARNTVGSQGRVEAKRMRSNCI
jgi:hypothetical protein